MIWRDPAVLSGGIGRVCGDGPIENMRDAQKIKRREKQ
jgi:hypothetical protein